MKSKIISLVVLLALLLGLLPVNGLVFAADNAQQVQFTAPVAIVNSSFLNVRTGPGIEYGVLVTVVGGTALPVLGLSRDRTWYQVSTVVGVGWVNNQYVIPRGNFQNVPFVAAPAIVNPLSVITTAPGTGGMGSTGTTVDDSAVDRGFSSGREWGVSVIIEHPLRAATTINAGEIAMQPVDPSVVYTVVGAAFAEGIHWVQVKTDNYTGWLESSKVLFRPYACTLSAVRFNQDVQLKRGPDQTGPNGDAFISNGHEAYLLDRVGALYKIEMVDGTIGWVEEGQFDVRQSANVRVPYCSGQQGVVTQPGGGNTTAQPGTGGQGTVTLPAGVAFGSIPHVVINTGFLNVRSGPGAQYTAVATVSGGTEMAVLGIASDRVWYLVQGSFGQGWVNSEYTLFRGDGSRLSIIRGAVGVVAAPTASLARESVTLYAAPNLTLGVVGTLSGNVTMEIVARTADNNWIQVKTSLGYGWIQREFLNLSVDPATIPSVG